MEHLHNGFTFELCHGAFPLSTDSIALGEFAKLPKNARVLDLGSGCGTLGLLLCAKDPQCHVTGIEINEDAHKMALCNAQQNGIADRLSSICADLRNISSLIPAGSFSCCVSNPPYFSAGPKSKRAPFARREDFCSPDAVMAAAAWALKYGANLFIVHRVERLAQLCACACAHDLQPKRLRLLRHQSHSAAGLILLQCRKGAKPGLVLEEKSLFLPDGTPTPYYRDLYHL